MKRETLILDERSLYGIIKKLSWEIYNRYSSNTPFALVGIYTRGAYLAQRIQKDLEKIISENIPVGYLDINLYRDDLSTLREQPQIKSTDILFDINQYNIILVDDVIFTGRTARSALDALVDLGRPKKVILTVLVDRGWREYPIQPDIVGIKLNTKLNEVVHLQLREVDKKEGLWLIEK